MIGSSFNYIALEGINLEAAMMNWIRSEHGFLKTRTTGKPTIYSGQYRDLAGNDGSPLYKPRHDTSILV